MSESTFACIQLYQFITQSPTTLRVDTTTRVSYEPSPSFTHSPATSSRGFRPERSRIEKKEAAGSGRGTPTVDGTVLRTYEVELVLDEIDDLLKI